MTIPTILTYVLGPMENNSYVIFDSTTRDAVVIDPSFDCEAMLADIVHRDLHLVEVLLTHAHFDHIAGVNELVNMTHPGLPVGLHPDDLDLYQHGGGAKNFGFPFEPGPVPQFLLIDKQQIPLGPSSLQVLHTPGHTPGHVVFYCREVKTVFCGDLIFAGSVGRTDLPGGSHRQLLQSIRKSIFTLPAETRLLSGHGFGTTVAEEMRSNPYIKSQVSG